MRFIITIVDDFKRIGEFFDIFSYDLDYKFLSYIDMKVDKLSLLELNRELSRISETKELYDCDLPLLNNYDYNILISSGYAIVRRINPYIPVSGRIYEDRWVVIFDLTHHKNARLMSIIRDIKLNELV